MIRIITLLALSVVVSACTASVVPPPKNADYYFSEGERLLEKNLYEDAIASWEKVRDSYYSVDLVIKAELKIAEAHFQAEQYLEASVAYENFLKNHPDYENEADVLYKLGLSYYHQILSADRDQSATRNARTTLKNFLSRYPDHPKAENARRLVQKCEQRLAAHEIYVGRFYLRTDEFQAAINRLEPVPKTHPDVPGLDKAWYYLGVAYLRSGQREAAVEAFNRLFEEFPDSPLIDKGQEVVAREF